MESEDEKNKKGIIYIFEGMLSDSGFEVTVMTRGPRWFLGGVERVPWIIVRLASRHSNR
jgi:hypothetical protein